MEQVIIKTQEEFNELPDKFKEYTKVIIINTEETIIVDKAWGNSSVEARENSSVEARENSSVVAWGNSSVEAWGNSRVEAWGNSSVEARENSSVEAWENSSVEARENSSVVAWGNSSVEAWGNSRVEAWGNSSVVARENSSVVARENSRVEAWENSSVVARENSSVEAWGNSSVVARENSSVVARENSRVEAWENSSVVAWGNVGVWLYSDYAVITLFCFSVCWEIAKGKIMKKSRNCLVQIPKILDWLENNGIEKKEKIILYKKVSKDFKTQENTKNKTLWEIGSVVEIKDWKPETDECGEGKFHACSRPYFCDEFRGEIGDRYIAIEVYLKDTYEWEKNPQYPHKISFRVAKVLYEVDKFGKKI